MTKLTQFLTGALWLTIFVVTTMIGVLVPIGRDTLVILTEPLMADVAGREDRPITIYLTLVLKSERHVKALEMSATERDQLHRLLLGVLESQSEPLLNSIRLKQEMLQAASEAMPELGLNEIIFRVYATL